MYVTIIVANCESDLNDVLLDVQYLVANCHLLHVGPTDTVESQDQEFEVPDIKVRPTANDNAVVLVVGQTCPNITYCTDCSKLLQILAHLQEQHVAGSNGDCGVLCVPSDQFVSFIT